MTEIKRNQQGHAELNIAICGVGGQGNLLLERVICNSCLKEGYEVKAADTFGAAQRGGSVVSHLRIGNEIKSSLIGKGRCDIVVGLEPGEALRTASSLLRENGVILVNKTPVPPVSVKVGKREYPSFDAVLNLLKRVSPRVMALDATALARKTTGNERSINMVMLGALIGLKILPVTADTVRQAISELTGASAPSNLKAFEEGFQICGKEFAIEFKSCAVA